MAKKQDAASNEEAAQVETIFRCSGCHQIAHFPAEPDEEGRRHCLACNEPVLPEGSEQPEQSDAEGSEEPQPEPHSEPSEHSEAAAEAELEGEEGQAAPDEQEVQQAAE